MANSKKNQLIVELDEKMHKDFKRLCVESDVSMVSVVRADIKKWIDAKKKNVIY